MVKKHEDERPHEATLGRSRGRLFPAGQGQPALPGLRHCSWDTGDTREGWNVQGSAGDTRDMREGWNVPGHRARAVLGKDGHCHSPSAHLLHLLGHTGWGSGLPTQLPHQPQLAALGFLLFPLSIMLSPAK